MNSLSGTLVVFALSIAVSAAILWFNRGGVDSTESAETDLEAVLAEETKTDIVPEKIDTGEKI